MYTTCPKYYKLYEVNLINCTVSLSKVAQASCSIPADDVQFYRSKNGVELSTCETVYNASSCEPARGGGKCGCVEHKGDQQVYQLQFVPTAADKSETFRCEVICSDAQNLQQEKHCPAISFGKYNCVTDVRNTTQTLIIQKIACFLASESSFIFT